VSARAPFRAPAFACRQGWGLILLALLGLLLAWSAARPAPASAAPAAPARRVLSLAPAITEMLYALDLGDRVVGRSSYCNFPPAALKKPSVGAALDLNEELVVALHPDLILATEGDAARRARLARLTGARVEVLGSQHVAQIWENMRRIGALTGTEAQAARKAAALKARLAAKTARPGGGPTVFYMVWDQPLMTAGRDSYLNDLITLAGGRNVVDLPGAAYPAFAWEALLAKDPQVILGPTNKADALKALAGRYPQLRAVKARRVRALPDDLISRPGPRVVEALTAVEQALR
jgi:iron complex transport system substrate-binding protein